MNEQRVLALELGALENRFVRLEPLTDAHVDGLIAAVLEAPDEYAIAPVPTNLADMRVYVRRARSDLAAGRAVPFAIIRKERHVSARTDASGESLSGPSKERIVGSTRLMSLEWWDWPPGPVRVAGEPRRAAAGYPPDVAEMGHIWLARSALRTSINTAACLLLMTHAFEVWRVHRLTIKTDERNQRSRNAIARLGGQFEGILRSHCPAADGVVRNTAMFSILPTEWPQTKARLESSLDAPRHKRI